MGGIKYLSSKRSWDCHLYYDDGVGSTVVKEISKIIRRYQKMTNFSALLQEQKKVRDEGHILDFATMLTSTIVDTWSKDQLVVRRDLALIKHEDNEDGCAVIMKLRLAKLKKDHLSGTPIWWCDETPNHITNDGNDYKPVYSKHVIDRMFGRLYPNIKMWHQPAWEMAFSKEPVAFTKDNHFRKILTSNSEYSKMLFIFMPYSIEDGYIIYTTLLIDGMHGTPHEVLDYIPEDVAINNNKYLDLISKGICEETWEEFREL